MSNSEAPSAPEGRPGRAAGRAVVGALAGATVAGVLGLAGIMLSEGMDALLYASLAMFVGVPVLGLIGAVVAIQLGGARSPSSAGAASPGAGASPAAGPRMSHGMALALTFVGLSALEIVPGYVLLGLLGTVVDVHHPGFGTWGLLPPAVAVAVGFNAWFSAWLCRDRRSNRDRREGPPRP